jgi:hypothetical protein
LNHCQSIKVNELIGAGVSDCVDQWTLSSASDEAHALIGASMPDSGKRPLLAPLIPRVIIIIFGRLFE